MSRKPFLTEGWHKMRITKVQTVLIPSKFDEKMAESWVNSVDLRFYVIFEMTVVESTLLAAVGDEVFYVCCFDDVGALVGRFQAEWIARCAGNAEITALVDESLRAVMDIGRGLPDKRCTRVVECSAEVLADVHKKRKRVGGEYLAHSWAATGGA